VSPLSVLFFGSTGRGGDSGSALSFRKQFLPLDAAFGCLWKVQAKQPLVLVQSAQHAPAFATLEIEIEPGPTVRPVVYGRAYQQPQRQRRLQRRRQRVPGKMKQLSLLAAWLTEATMRSAAARIGSEKAIV